MLDVWPEAERLPIWPAYVRTMAAPRARLLGLSMIYGFATAIEGSAKICSQVGQGTTVNYTTIANGFLEPGMEVIAKPFALEALASRVRPMTELDLG